MGIENERREYEGVGLRRSGLPSSPIDLLQQWLSHAQQHPEVVDPTAMSLCTVSAEGHPDGRIVLLKGIEDGRLLFYTNTESEKAEQLRFQPRATLVFYWGPLSRQVRVQGHTETVSSEIARGYFQSRPKTSQITAWASAQSRTIPNRESLEQAYRDLETQYAKDEVLPLPPFWGGFALKPARFEFWQGLPSRLHDRFVYTPAGEGWGIQRLAP